MRVTCPQCGNDGAFRTRCVGRYFCRRCGHRWGEGPPGAPRCADCGGPMTDIRRGNRRVWRCLDCRHEAFIPEEPESGIPFPATLLPPVVTRKLDCRGCIYRAQCHDNARAGCAVLCERVGFVYAGGVRVEV